MTEAQSFREATEGSRKPGLGLRLDSARGRPGGVFKSSQFISLVLGIQPQNLANPPGLLFIIKLTLQS